MGILPPGFRFHPTDVELIMYYLKRKVMGKKFQFEAVAELNIYKYAPWDLADKSLLRRDLEWYFFSPREKKYGSGGRTNRATETGYWKTTGKDRPVSYNDRNVGMIKTLIFYKGHAPKGERTDWVMHEYRIEDKNLADIGIIQDSYALCKIFQKSGLGPKNGAQYGAPFREEEWDELESVGLQGDSPFTVNLQPSSYINSTAMSSAVATPSGSWPMSKEIQCPARPFAIDMPCSMAGPSGIVSGLPMSMCTDVVMRPIENYTTENAIVSFESCQRTATGPKTDATFCEEELNDVEEVSAISSPVNGQVLSVHLPCRELYDSAELSSILPGTSSTWSLSEPGPSTPSTVVTNLPSYGANLPEDDIPALLSMFSESSSMLLTENNNDEHLSTVHIDKSVEAHSCGEKNAVNGPGDSYNFGKQGDPGFDFSNTWDTSKRMLLEDDMVFVELKDLDTPLNHRADDSESLWAQVDSQYAPYTCFQDLDGSYYESNLQNNVQDVPRLILPFFPPESPRWMDDILEVSGKGLDTQNLEGYGPDTCMGYEIPFQISCRQPDESSNSDQIQRRGSIHHFP